VNPSGSHRANSQICFLLYIWHTSRMPKNPLLRGLFFRLSFCFIILLTFLVNSLGPIPTAQAASGELLLPAVGSMVNLSPAYEPPLIKGLRVHQDNPFLFDFILDAGHSGLSGASLKKESDRLIKYFFACLTIPEKDIWVNLSPYEKERIIPQALGQTALGRDLLSQDYILKQLTAPLIYPEKNLGKEFWNRVYAKARQMYGTTQIPVNTFNKVWILADKATVYEQGQTAFIINGHLKVMLDEDYMALKKNHVRSSVASQVVREIIIPEIEKEVNQGNNFAMLRQIFYSQILATWYKKNLKEALLNQVYADRSTVKGVNLNDPSVKEKIYQQYLKAYKKGVFNYIKSEPQEDGPSIPRKYFSGGYSSENFDPVVVTDQMPGSRAMVSNAFSKAGPLYDISADTLLESPNSNSAMTVNRNKALALLSALKSALYIIVGKDDRQMVKVIKQILAEKLKTTKDGMITITPEDVEKIDPRFGAKLKGIIAGHIEDSKGSIELMDRLKRILLENDLLGSIYNDGSIRFEASDIYVGQYIKNHISVARRGVDGEGGSSITLLRLDHITNNEWESIKKKLIKVLGVAAKNGDKIIPLRYDDELIILTGSTQNEINEKIDKMLMMTDAAMSSNTKNFLKFAFISAITGILAYKAHYVYSNSQEFATSLTFSIVAALLAVSYISPSSISRVLKEKRIIRAIKRSLAIKLKSNKYDEITVTPVDIAGTDREAGELLRQFLMLGPIRIAELQKILIRNEVEGTVNPDGSITFEEPYSSIWQYINDNKVIAPLGFHGEGGSSVTLPRLKFIKNIEWTRMSMALTKVLRDKPGANIRILENEGEFSKELVIFTDLKEGEVAWIINNMVLVMDPAMEASPGGIDLNTSNGMQWNVSKEGQGVEMIINPTMLARIKEQGIESLSPVIFKITPVQDIWSLVTPAVKA